MMFSATFNNSSVIIYRSQKAKPNHKYNVIGTDCIGSCKSNYHTITATTAPDRIMTYLISELILSTKSSEI
jgi:predicted metal-binding protein